MSGIPSLTDNDASSSRPVAHGKKPHRIIETWLAPLIIVVGVSLQSMHLGTDDNWDLRNYHVYNPFAYLNKLPGTDVVAAQVQTFLAPTIDLVPYLLRNRFNDSPKLLTLILGVPTAIAAILAFRIGLRLVAPTPDHRLLSARWLLVMLALLLGITGTSNLQIIGSSLSDMPDVCFLLGALLIVLHSVGDPAARHSRTLIAGLLAGIAIGIKLTAGPFGVATGLALFLCLEGSFRQKTIHLLMFGLGGLIGASITGGPWWLHLYNETGSPIFPYYNAVFKSPLYDAVNISDDRFRPLLLKEKVFFPFFWAFTPNLRNSELPIRDPRMAMTYLLVIGTLLLGVTERARDVGRAHAVVNRTVACFALFLGFGFILWEVQFSILRYLAVLELLCGFALLPLAAPLLRSGRTRWLPSILLAGLCICAAFYTIYPHWRSSPPHDGHAITVDVPVLPKDSMVLELSSDPMSFVAAYMDPATRFVGVISNMINPKATSGLAQRVEATVRSHRGPLWTLETEAPSRQKEEALDFYGLRRTGQCLHVRTNLDDGNLRICRLAPA